MTANGIRHGLTPEANSLGQTTRAHAHTAWPYAAPLSQRRIKYHRARRSSAELAQRPTAAATTVSGGKRETFRAHKRPTRELRPRLLSTVFLAVVVLVPIRSVRRRHAALTPFDDTQTRACAQRKRVTVSFRACTACFASRAHIGGERVGVCVSSLAPAPVGAGMRLSQTEASGRLQWSGVPTVRSGELWTGGWSYRAAMTTLWWR